MQERSGRREEAGGEEEEEEGGEEEEEEEPRSPLAEIDRRRKAARLWGHLRVQPSLGAFFYATCLSATHRRCFYEGWGRMTPPFGTVAQK